MTGSNPGTVAQYVQIKRDVSPNRSNKGKRCKKYNNNSDIKRKITDSGTHTLTHLYLPNLKFGNIENSSENTAISKENNKAINKVI